MDNRTICNDAAHNAFEHNPSKNPADKSTGSRSWEQGQSGQGNKTNPQNPSQGGKTGGQTGR